MANAVARSSHSAAPAREQQRPSREAEPVSLLDSVIAKTMQSSETRSRIQPFMPRGVTYDRVSAAVLEEFAKNPKLADCSETSLIAAIIKIQKWGLDIGETAYLVPYWDKGTRRLVCTPIRDYKGDIQLLIEHRIARRVDAMCVYSKEPFKYVEGMHPVLEHQPLPPSMRGTLIGAYAIVWQTFTHAKAQFLWLEEIEEIRKTYSKQWTEEKVGPVPTWYARKCAVKAATKLLPKTAQVREVARRMEEDERPDLDEEEAPRPAISLARPAHISLDGEDAADVAAERGEPARDAATDEQIERLLDLSEDARIDDDVRERVRSAVARGMTTEKASDWIARIEKRLADAAPAAEGEQRADPTPASSPATEPSTGDAPTPSPGPKSSTDAPDPVEAAKRPAKVANAVKANADAKRAASTDDNSLPF